MKSDKKENSFNKFLNPEERSPIRLLTSDFNL